MRYLLVLTLAIGCLLIGCEKKKPIVASPPPPITAGPEDIMTGIPAAPAMVPAVAPASPTPTPIPTATPTTSAMKGTRMYTVKPKEGLMEIARRELGDAKRMKEILALNPDIKNANLVKAGQVIKLPEK